MSGKPQHSDEEVIDGLRKILEQHPGISLNAYEKLNEYPSRSALRGHFPGVPWPELCKKALAGETPESAKADYDVPEHHRVLMHENAQLKKANTKLLNITQIFVDTCLPAINRCSFKASPVPTPEKVMRDQEFHSMQGDIHIGEHVDTDWAPGASGCSMDILLNERLPKLGERIVTFREQDKNALGLNKLTIHMLGDMVTGELIYKGQSWFIDALLVDQLMQGSEAYINFILMLAKHFPQIEIFCVIGNHGRHGKKGDAHPRSNFDYLFYMMLQRALRGQGNVTVYVAMSPTLIVQHGEFVFALNHNDNVMGWNGIPYYGLDRKARRMDGLYNMKIHYKLGGHFHTPAELNDETLLNGTMMGGSDLSVNKMMVATRPSQKIFYFDPHHGIHRTTNIYLADPVKLTADENGIFTAYTA